MNDLDELLVEYHILHKMYKREEAARIENEKFIMYLYRKSFWNRLLFGRKYIRTHIRKMNRLRETWNKRFGADGGK